MIRPDTVFVVTAHYSTGGVRAFPPVAKGEALRLMRGALKYDRGASFDVQGPMPAPARVKGVWN